MLMLKRLSRVLPVVPDLLCYAGINRWGGGVAHDRVRVRVGLDSILLSEKLYLTSQIPFEHFRTILASVTRIRHQPLYSDR